MRRVLNLPLTHLAAPRSNPERRSSILTILRGIRLHLPSLGGRFSSAENSSASRLAAGEFSARQYPARLR